MITHRDRELRRMWQLKSESLRTPQDKVKRKGSRISLTSSTAETEKDVESTPRYVNNDRDQQPEIEDLKALRLAASAQEPGDDALEAPPQEETKKPRSTRPPASKAAAKPAAKRASRPAVPKSKADKKKDAANRESAPKRKAAAKKEPKKATTTESAGNGGEELMQKEPKEKPSVVADGKRKRAEEPHDARETLRSTGSTDSIPSVLQRGCTADQFADEDLAKIAHEAEQAVDRAKAAKKAKKERDPVHHAIKMRFYRSLTSGALKCCQLQKAKHMFIIFSRS